VILVVGLLWAALQLQRSPYFTYAGLHVRSRFRFLISITSVDWD